MKPLAFENKEKITELETKIAELESTISTLQTTVNNKVNKYTINTFYNEAKWCRVAKLNDTTHDASSFIITVDTRYSNTNNLSLIFAVNVTWQKANITLLSSKENADGLISQVRVVKEEGNEGAPYFEIYYNVSVGNPVRTTVINPWASVEMLAEETTDTATVLATLEI